MSPLKEFRLARGLMQIEISKRIGISPQLLSKYEWGGIVPAPEIRRRLSIALDVNPSVLFPGVED